MSMPRWTEWMRPSMRDRVVVWSILLLTALDYMVRHQMHWNHPRSLGMTGWWLWDDQGYYIRAARAWAAGNLDPAQHWYLPGYPLLGAAFAWLTPVQPFYLPDLLCLIAFGWLFTWLAERLAPDLRWTRITGALVFFVTVALSPLAMKSFVEPWTTTPTAPLTLASLLLAMRFWDRPSARSAALLGFATASVLLFRPTDAGILIGVVAGFAGAALMFQRLGWAATAKIMAAGIAGAAAPALLVAGLQVAIFGWTTAGYIEQSSRTGFEWRLLPLNWVTLFVSPMPLLPEGAGMAQIFPWIVPGVAGMAACLVAARGRAWVRHALVITAVVAHCAVYLAYRDLHPPGLLRFSNYHYFKWVVPVFGLYAVYLVALVLGTARARWAWAAGLAAVVALFGWRAEWVTPAPGYRTDEAVVEAPRTLILKQGLHSVLDGVRVGASGDFAPIFLAPYAMQAGGVTYVANADLKSYPIPGGLMFTTLRPLAHGPAAVTFNPGVTLNPAAAAQIGRQTLVFGWPNWGRSWWRGQHAP
jgi:hypothetical protein